MTPRQKELARHALGLPNKKCLSYRNHFVAGYGHVDYDEWRAMVRDGLAVQRGGGAMYGGDDIFHLTFAGGTAALEHEERLDKTDFPSPLMDLPEIAP